MENYLLYQAYGKKEVKLECKFSLLHLLSKNFQHNLCPVIYTDDITFFENILKDFPSKIIRGITTEEIQEWRGEINFLHRVKIKILMDFLDNHAGNLLYCDTDTYFLQSPNTIFSDLEKGEFYMHILEGRINKKTDIQFKKWEKFLMNHMEIVNVSNHSEINQIEMWNAGVIGFNSKYKELLKAVLDLTDKIYPLFPKHIAEQFSFSYIFQRKVNIRSASNYIFHFWYLKEFGHYLEKIFEQNSENDYFLQIKKIRLLPEELLKEKLDYEGRSKLFRLLRGKWKL